MVGLPAVPAWAVAVSVVGMAGDVTKPDHESHVLTRLVDEADVGDDKTGAVGRGTVEPSAKSAVVEAERSVDRQFLSRLVCHIIEVDLRESRSPGSEPQADRLIYLEFRVPEPEYYYKKFLKHVCHLLFLRNWIKSLLLKLGQVSPRFNQKRISLISLIQLS